MYTYEQIGKNIKSIDNLFHSDLYFGDYSDKLGVYSGICRGLTTTWVRAVLLGLNDLKIYETRLQLLARDYGGNPYHMGGDIYHQLADIVAVATTIGRKIKISPQKNSNSNSNSNVAIAYNYHEYPDWQQNDLHAFITMRAFIEELILIQNPKESLIFYNYYCQEQMHKEHYSNENLDDNYKPYLMPSYQNTETVTKFLNPDKPSSQLSCIYSKSFIETEDVYQMTLLAYFEASACLTVPYCFILYVRDEDAPYGHVIGLTYDHKTERVSLFDAGALSDDSIYNNFYVPGVDKYNVARHVFSCFSEYIDVNNKFTSLKKDSGSKFIEPKLSIQTTVCISADNVAQAQFGKSFNPMEFKLKQYLKIGSLRDWIDHPNQTDVKKNLLKYIASLSDDRSYTEYHLEPLVRENKHIYRFLIELIMEQNVKVLNELVQLLRRLHISSSHIFRLDSVYDTCPLREAFNSKNIEIFKIMLDYLELDSTIVAVIFSLACEKGFFIIAKLLYNKAKKLININQPNAMGDTPLTLAHRNKNIEIFQWLISEGATDTESNGKGTRHGSN